MSSLIHLIFCDENVLDIQLNVLREHFGLFEFIGQHNKLGVSVVTDNTINLSGLPIKKAALMILLAISQYGDACVSCDLMKSGVKYEDVITAHSCLDTNVYVNTFIEHGHLYNRFAMFNICPLLFEATVYESIIRRDIALGETSPLHGLVPVSCDELSNMTKTNIPKSDIHLFEKVLSEERTQQNLSEYYRMAIQHQKEENDKTLAYALDIINKVILLGNVCVAGGAALQILNQSCAAGDIDVFIWGLTEEQANAKVRQIVNLLGSKYNCCFTGNAYTFALSRGVILQVICRLYTSPSEIIHGFDIQACKVLAMYDDNDGCMKFYGTRTFIESMVHNCVWVDTERQSKTYAVRLIKYFAKGFDVIVPGLVRRQLDCEIMTTGMKQLKGLAFLMRLEREIRVKIDNYWQPVLTRDNVKSAMFTVMKSQRLAKSDYSDISLSVFGTTKLHSLIKFATRFYHKLIKKMAWKKVIKNKNMKVVGADAKWVQRDPSSQTVSGCFYPEDEKYYHVAYRANSADELP